MFGILFCHHVIYVVFIESLSSLFYTSKVFLEYFVDVQLADEDTTWPLLVVHYDLH